MVQTGTNSRVSRTPFYALLGILLLILTTAAPAQVPPPVDAIWLATPPSNDWNSNANWSPPQAPVMSGDTATFNTSTMTAPTLSNDVTIDSITFNSGASAFTIHTNGNTLTLLGLGIVNNSGAVQTIVNESFESDGVLFTGRTIFLNGATAADVTINNSGAGISTEFHNTSSAANATIINNPGKVAGAQGGRTFFFDSSNAGDATFTNTGSAVAGATLGIFAGGVTFSDSSHAGSGTFINLGGTAADAAGGFTAFVFDSNADSATLIAQGGTNGGQGGEIDFADASTGGTSRIELFGNGRLDLASHSPIAPITIGSIEGDGNVFLVGNNLTVGTNNRSTTFSGVIQDRGASGSLTKVGTGTLDLTGTNTYTGDTTINGGVLKVDGSIGTMTSNIFVNPGGTLAGMGVIGGSVLNNGVVSPGNTVGTLTINNNYTQSGGGTLRIQIAGVGASGSLMIGGTANLGGTLQVIRLNNFQLQPGDQITFLTANGGVNGTFATVQNDFATSGTIVESQVLFSPNSIVLVASQGQFTDVPGLTPNQMAVAIAVDSAVGDPRAAPLIDFLNSEPVGNLPHDFDLIAPEALASTFSFGISTANIQTDNLERRMNNVRGGSTGFSAAGFSINTRGHDFNLGLAGPSGAEGKGGPSVMQPTPGNRWGVFVTGIGEFTDVDSTDNASGYDLSTGGVTFGVDYRLSPNFAIGMMGGYAHTNGDLAEGGNLDVDGGKIGLYATAFSGGFYVNGAATGGLNDYDTRRTALLGTASGDTEGHEFTGLIAGGYDWKKGNLTVGPIASFQYTYVDFDGFTEHGSLAPLTFNDQSADSSRTALGAKASYDWNMGRVLVKPEIRAAWQHEFGDTDYSIVSRFANGAGNSFTVTGPAIGRDSLLLGAGAAVLFNDRVSAYAYYDGELARTNYSSHNVSGGVRITF
jgi:outer membrane autotransporter protein